MIYKLIRLSSDIHDEQREKYSEQFLDDLNLILNEDDVYLDEYPSEFKYNIVLIESGGSEEKFAQIFPSLTKPLIIINTNKYNSLAASMEIGTYCHQQGVEPYVFYGDVNELARIIKRISDVLSIKDELIDLNLGVIGKPSSWLIASNMEYSLIKEKLGINMIDIDYDEFISEINKKEYIPPKQYDDLILKIKDRKDDLEKALHIYGALKRLIFKYNLKGLTIRCFELLKTHKSTACLALSLLNSEGLIATCEGDVPSLISMTLIEKITGFSSFQANPSTIDIEKEEVMFSHCTLPLNMTSDYELDTHFESNLGVAIKGELEKGNVTILKIANDFSRYLCLEGTIIENLSFEGFCRTQILVKLDPQQMIAFATSQVGNHMIISYGRNYNKIAAFFAMLFPNIEQ